MFTRGGQYANRFGEYEVLEISNSTMRVRYLSGSKSGETQDLTIELQERIWQNIQDERNPPLYLGDLERYYEATDDDQSQAFLAHDYLEPDELPHFRVTVCWSCGQEVASDERSLCAGCRWGMCDACAACQCPTYSVTFGGTQPECQEQIARVGAQKHAHRVEEYLKRLRARDLKC